MKKGDLAEVILLLKFGPHGLLDLHVMEAFTQQRSKEKLTASNGCGEKCEVKGTIHHASNAPKSTEGADGGKWRVG